MSDMASDPPWDDIRQIVREELAVICEKRGHPLLGDEQPPQRGPFPSYDNPPSKACLCGKRIGMIYDITWQ